jgi:hypothetical protein
MVCLRGFGGGPTLAGLVVGAFVFSVCPQPHNNTMTRVTSVFMEAIVEGREGKGKVNCADYDTRSPELGNPAEFSFSFAFWNQSKPCTRMGHDLRRMDTVTAPSAS